MATLSDQSIEALHEEHADLILPWRDEQLQPASYDVRLGRDFRLFNNLRSDQVIDPKVSRQYTMPWECSKAGPLRIEPGAFVLGMVEERIDLPDDILARVEGKSSMGRLGIMVHATAGFVDPGYCGHLTLELSNVAPNPVNLYPGMLIAQLAFERLETPARIPYEGKYQAAVRPGESQAFADFSGWDE